MANKYYVIDTNVFIAANGGADHLSDEKIDKCKLFIGTLFSDTVISLDVYGEIFKEYFKYMNWSGQPGISDVFVKHLWDHQYDTVFCEMVDTERDKNGAYKQINDKDDLLAFDPNDFKFIAVYFGSNNPVKICNASDSDWKNDNQLLTKYNIEVYEVLKEASP